LDLHESHRCRRGAVPAHRSRHRGATGAGSRWSQRQAPGLPDAGAQPRSEHARLEVGGPRGHSRGARSQAADRADAGTDTEHRVMGGNLFIVCAPSGAGKTTLVAALLKSDPEIRLSISFTTRQPRPEEVDGRDYRFVTESVFAAMAQRGEFLESA